MCVTSATGLWSHIVPSRTGRSVAVYDCHKISRNGANGSVRFAAIYVGMYILPWHPYLQSGWIRRKDDHRNVNML